MASCARWRARMESWLAVIAVARKVKSATQFCGSAMVNAPIGGRKKKLKQHMASTAASTASVTPKYVAIRRIASRKAKPAVVALTGNTRRRQNVTAAISSSEAAMRPAMRNVCRFESKRQRRSESQVVNARIEFAPLSFPYELTRYLRGKRDCGPHAFALARQLHIDFPPGVRDRALGVR